MSIWPHKTPPPMRPVQHVPSSETMHRSQDPEIDRGYDADSDLIASVLEQAGHWDAQPRSDAETPSRSIITWTLPGFDRRCRISTNFGDLPIEALRRHDKVKTLSGAYRSVERIDEIRLDADFLARHPEAHPVQIRLRTFTAGQPVRNTLVSPAQPVCPSGHVGSHAATVALDMVGLPGICRLPQAEMTYFRFHCGSPETVCVDGAWFHIAPWT